MRSSTVFSSILPQQEMATTVGENSNKTLDEKALEIIGLEYQSETELNMQNISRSTITIRESFPLLEVDMTKDTARDPEKTSKETLRIQRKRFPSPIRKTAQKIRAVRVTLRKRKAEIPRRIRMESVKKNWQQNCIKAML